MPAQGDPLVARMHDGSSRTLHREERQHIEPSAYCLEAGWWAIADEDDAYYFVSDDGRVDIHDADTLSCVHEGAGVAQDVYDAYWRMEAAAEEAERRSR